MLVDLLRTKGCVSRRQVFRLAVTGGSFETGRCKGRGGVQTEGKKGERRLSASVSPSSYKAFPADRVTVLLSGLHPIHSARSNRLILPAFDRRGPTLCSLFTVQPSFPHPFKRVP